MTDTPSDQQDVLVKPPPATVYAKAGIAAVVVMNARGVVEKLTTEGASDQTIAEAIRRESPELADAVDALVARRPRGASFATWAMLVLTAWMAVLHTYQFFHPQAPPPSIEEIAQILEDAISKPAPVSEDDEAGP